MLGKGIILFVYAVTAKCSEEPKCPTSYIEEKLLEKMIEMDFKLKKALELLEGNGLQPGGKCGASKTDEHLHSDVDSGIFGSQSPTCLLDSPTVLQTSALETNGWQLVFRAASGNGQNVYNAWMKGENTTEDKPPKMERSYFRHYRSREVINWSNLDIKYVKFALYEQNKEVASVIFNGIGSNIENWFDKNRIIYSSWSDLTINDDYNHFSIAGYNAGTVDRRFHINKFYGGCEKDIGHIAVIDTGTVAACAWDQHPVYPQFLYTKINSADVWYKRQFGRADFMTIFIKT